MEIPGLTFDEVDRRKRIRALSPTLPLDTSDAEIERLEAARKPRCSERRDNGEQCIWPAGHTGSHMSLPPVRESLQAGRNPTERYENPSENPPDVIEAPPLPLEKSVQQQVRELYESVGCKVRNLSQARASKQSPGFADLWVTHRKCGIAFWHETKRPGGDLSDAQREFRDDCIATRTKHVSGGVEEARVAIARWGLRP